MSSNENKKWRKKRFEEDADPEAVSHEAMEKVAKVAGLRDFHTPTLEAVEHRRLQLWVLTILILLTVALSMVLVTAQFGLRLPEWFGPRIMQISLLVMVVLFSAYAIEKEIQLRTLTRMLVRERVLTASLISRIREITTLLEAGKAINLNLDLNQVLDTILRCTLDLLDGRDATIMLVYGGNELRSVSGDVEVRIPFGEGLAGRVAETREPLLVTRTPMEEASGDKTAASSAMCVPMIHRGQLLGVIHIESGPSRTYTQHDLRALSLFGEQAAAAVANAQLYEEQRFTASRRSYQALHDPLTKLPNRLLFFDRVDHALLRRRDRKHRVALFFVDLDDFKQLNDELGHTGADEVLVQIAERIRANVRSGDTVARFGGDEFAVLEEEVTSREHALNVAERVREAIRQTLVVSTGEAEIDCSIGIALESDRVRQSTELMRNADNAMHEAKGRGKGQLVVYDDSMRSETVQRLDLEEELRKALREGQFQVYYQPIVSLPDERVVGVEALVRWNHPRRGLLQAQSFVALADRCGVLRDIDRHVHHTACETGNELLGMAGAAGTVTMNINLPPDRLQDPTLRDDLGDVLKHTGLPPNSLTLEITESAILSDPQHAQGVMRELRALGVQIALDDFGTGYSSLSYLNRLPIDAVKIDRLFVEGLANQSGETELVDAIVKLGLGLKLDVIAKGVERPLERDKLVRLGCPMAQGRFFSEPVNRDDLLAYVREHGTGNGQTRQRRQERHRVE